MRNKQIKNKQIKNKQFKFSLFTILMTFSLIPLILSVAIISTTSLYITKNNSEEGAKDTLFIVANNLASYCKENEINVMNSGDYYYFLDSLKEQNIEMAILLEDAPCATSIKNENDYRIREIECEKDVATNPEIAENGFYDNEVVIDGKVYCAYYMPIKANDEIIGMAFAGELQEHVTGATKSIIVTFVGVAISLVILFLIITLLFSKGLLKSFDTVGRNVNTLSKGDLNKQKEHKSSVKEMNALLFETSLMQKNLSETIGNVKKLSKRLVESIIEVTKLSESSSGRAKQITTAMDELSVSTMGMAENVQDINSQMLEIGNSINDIVSHIEHLYNSSENILQTNGEAKINMNTIMENSKKSVTAINDISSQIKETNDSIVDIDKAVELILSISDQTNLLSLNASIEAARAGAHGRGFSVVAEEIRHLSEQSSEGAEMIKNIAQKITEKSKRSVQLADGVYSLIMLEQENVLKTQKKYEELSENIDQSVNEIKSISEKTDNLTNYKEKVIENVQDLSAISQENAASNEEVNANINEIIAEVKTVNENCEKMNRMALELEESVSYFHN